MRISEMLKREPLGDLITEALERYFKSINDVRIVKWSKKRAFSFDSFLLFKNSTWICNIYTNCIFSPQCNKVVYEPLKREFSNSLHWWKKLLQRIYVNLSFSKYCSPFLSQYTVNMGNEVPDGVMKIIIPGNHKIRVLDFNMNLCHSIMKKDYPSNLFRNEIDIRKRVEQTGVALPKIVNYTIDEKIMSEKLVIGTPLNRLPVAKQVASLSKALQMIEKLNAASLRPILLTDYIMYLMNEIERLAQNRKFLHDDFNVKISTIVNTLCGAIEKDHEKTINVALSHGDFQPGNILVNDSEVILIDWEYSAERICGYDYLVYFLKSRFPNGLGKRIELFINDTIENNDLPTVKKISALTEGYSSKQLSYIFILEDLFLRLQENSFTFILSMDSGVILYVNEILQFLKNQQLL